MPSQFQKFKALHHNENIFVLPNAWDAQSALILEEKHFPAIGTSSAAVAKSLGYDDGEKISFSDYLFVIRRIASCIKVPLTVDMEMGYGKTNEEIYANLLTLIELDVAGINIEDSIINNSTRTLQDAHAFAKKIEYLRAKLESEKLNLFINIRCDTYILNIENKQKETLSRLKAYETIGADGIFLPCISNENDIAEAVTNTKLPVNVMCIQGIPAIEVLEKLGVKRASMGPFLFQKIYNSIGGLSQAIHTDKNFSSILS